MTKILLYLKSIRQYQFLLFVFVHFTFCELVHQILYCLLLLCTYLVLFLQLLLVPLQLLSSSLIFPLQVLTFTNQLIVLFLLNLQCIVFVVFVIPAMSVIFFRLFTVFLLHQFLYSLHYFLFLFVYFLIIYIQNLAKCLNYWVLYYNLNCFRRPLLFSLLLFLHLFQYFKGILCSLFALLNDLLLIHLKYICDRSKLSIQYNQYMQPQSPKKILLRKSSFEIQDTNTQNQEEPAYRQSLKDDSSNNQNLLDLSDLQTSQNISIEYQEFLNNRIIEIQGPQLITQNVLKSYKLYKIKSRKKEQENYDTCVKRRYSDFEYLEKKLLKKYGGCIIRKLPQKNLWTNINMEGEQYIEERKKKLKKYIENLINHPKVRKSQELKMFLFSDEIKFSQGKGEFFSSIKAQDKFKNLASSAFSLGKGLLNKYIYSTQQLSNSIKISNPTMQDLKLLEYENNIGGMMKATEKLKFMVENTVNQMTESSHIFGNKLQFSPQILRQQFQNLCEYIQSCNEALMRRSQIRLQMQQLTREYERLQKKLKGNPRSQQIDMIRNRLTKVTQTCVNWTDTLLSELQNSVELGKSMVLQFMNSYNRIKQKFYNYQL